MFLLAYQCAGKYKAEKKQLHLAAAILLALQGLLGYQFMVIAALRVVVRMLPLPVALVLLYLEDLRSEDESVRGNAMTAAIVAGGATLLQVLSGYFTFRMYVMGFPRFVVALFMLASCVALFVESAWAVTTVNCGAYDHVITKEKTAAIAEAEGAATAIKMINEANPTAAYLTLKGYEALKVMADGNATKIIVPSDIQNVAGLLSSLKAVVEEDDKKKSK